MDDFNIFGAPPRRGKAPKNPFDFSLENNSSSPKYNRVPVTATQKKEVLFRQKDKCAWKDCRVHFHRDGVPPHFDHIKRVDNGGKSLTSNLQALCPNHHNVKTHKEDLKKAEKSRKKSTKREEGGLFSGNLLSPPRRRKGSNPFGFRF